MKIAIVLSLMCLTSFCSAQPAPDNEEGKPTLESLKDSAAVSGGEVAGVEPKAETPEAEPNPTLPAPTPAVSPEEKRVVIVRCLVGARRRGDSVAIKRWQRELKALASQYHATQEYLHSENGRFAELGRAGFLTRGQADGLYAPKNPQPPATTPAPAAPPAVSGITLPREGQGQGKEIPTMLENIGIGALWLLGGALVVWLGWRLWLGSLVGAIRTAGCAHADNARSYTGQNASTTAVTFGSFAAVFTGEGEDTREPAVVQPGRVQVPRRRQAPPDE